MSGKEKYGKYPVPSAAESASASWMAPLIACGLTMFVSMQSQDRRVIIAVGAIAGIIVVIGFLSGIWAIYVATGWGPKKHLLPAGICIILSTLLLCISIQSFRLVAQLKAEQKDSQIVEHVTVPQIVNTATTHWDAATDERYGTAAARDRR